MSYGGVHGLLSVNALAMERVRLMLDNPSRYGVEVSILRSGATVLDMGVNAKGSWLAALEYVRVVTGGLAEVSYSSRKLAGRVVPVINVFASEPIMSCVGCQIAGFKVKAGEYSPIGSGPARAIKGRDRYFSATPTMTYRDSSEEAVLAFQMDDLPDDVIAQAVAADCEVPVQNVYLLVAPTTSLVGTVQVAARVVGFTALNMVHRGYDIDTILSAWGTAPIPPLTKDPLDAMGRSNDAIIYGGTAVFTVKASDEYIERFLPVLTSSASEHYGTPFTEIFREAAFDFFEVKRLAPCHFSPAHLLVNNLESGRTLTAGRINDKALAKSFDLA
jgi:methenyltetrahydromethanopterin cyclohydrolase